MSEKSEHQGDVVNLQLVESRHHFPLYVDSPYDRPESKTIRFERLTVRGPESEPRQEIKQSNKKTDLSGMHLWLHFFSGGVLLVIVINRAFLPENRS